MFSQTQEYSLRAVLYLAHHYGKEPVGHLKIAAETAVPTAYLSKVLQGLVKAEVLVSRRGASGGFQLARDPAKLTVLEVVNAVEPIQRINTCPLGLKTHGKQLCPMHARLDNAMKLFEEALGNSAITEVMYEEGRPTPLVETQLD